MKVSLDLPDWCDVRDIYILAGIELAAYKLAKEDTFHVKIVRCDMCGKCCQNLVADGQYPVLENGDCANLIKDGERLVCKLGAMRPLPCCEGDPEKGGWNTGFCCIRYDGKE
jgi:hypothetical protein